MALRFYLTEVHELGAELSISQTLAPVTDAMRALAERSPDRNPHRQDEPYRRALTGMYARPGGHAAASSPAPRRCAMRWRRRSRMTSADEFLADLRVIEASLRRTTPTR